MRIVICLLAIVGLASAAEIQPPSARSISSTLEDAIINMRDQMPCGFPKSGIPPVAPYELSHHDVNVDSPELRVKGTLDNIIIENLDHFVPEVKVNVIKSIVSYRFDFNNVRVATLYDLSTFLKKYGFTIDMVANGNFDVTIKDFVVWGQSKYSLGIISKKLKLKTLVAHIRIGEVKSNIDGILGDGPYTAEINKIVAKTIPALINDNDKFISETFESTVLPLVNDYLTQHKLDELISASGGDTNTCEQ